MVYGFATRIADGEWLVDELRCVHQIAESRFIHRRGNYHARNDVHVSQVKLTMVGDTIFAYQPCSIDAEGDRQALDSDIVNDAVRQTCAP